MKFTYLISLSLSSMLLASCSATPSLASKYLTAQKTAQSGDAEGAGGEGDEAPFANGISVPEDELGNGDAEDPTAMTPTTSPTAMTPAPAATPAPSTTPAPATTPVPAPAPTPAPAVDDKTALTYANLNTQIFSACVPCHGVNGGVKLETYSLVKSNIAGVEKHAITKGDMPPGDPLSDTQKKLLKDWIAKGMPEK